MKWIPDNHRFTVTTLIKLLSDMDYTQIRAILSISNMIKTDENLKNISDDTIYSYYQAEIETTGVQNNGNEKRGKD